METNGLKCQYEDCNILIAEGDYCFFHREEILDDEVEREIGEPDIYEPDQDNIEPETDCCDECGKNPCECGGEIECPGDIEPDFYNCERCGAEIDFGAKCDCEDNEIKDCIDEEIDEKDIEEE